MLTNAKTSESEKGKKRLADMRVYHKGASEGRNEGGCLFQRGMRAKIDKKWSCAVDKAWGILGGKRLVNRIGRQTE